MHNLTTDLTWVAYSCGAAGKIICNIIQQSKPYDKWYSTEETKDLDKFCKKLEKSSIEFISEPLQSDFDNVKTCFCYDFDNNLIQFVEGRKDFKSRK